MRRIEDSFQRDITHTCVRRCVVAAYETISAMQLLRQQGMQNSFWHNSHYVFSAVGVLMVFQTLGNQSTIDVGIPASTNIDRIILDGTILLEEVGAQMHSIATRYAQSLHQLQAKLRTLLLNKTRATQTAQPAPAGVAQTTDLLGVENVEDTTMSGSMNTVRDSMPQNAEPVQFFDFDTTAIDNLFYSPGWTGLFDDWNFGP